MSYHRRRHNNRGTTCTYPTIEPSTKRRHLPGYDDDFRREVYETPEQKLKNTIIKMGEVVSHEILLDNS